MRILVVEPERRPEVREIDDSLKAMQDIVGGLIQPIYFDDSVVLVYNDEGKLMDLPANRGLRNKDGQMYDIVFGTFFLCGAPADSDHFTSLAPEQIEQYRERSTPLRCSGAGWPHRLPAAGGGCDMRALRPMTQGERGFAEQEHQLVLDFLRYKHLPMNDFYDVVIFGHLSAVQQYFRDPPAGVEFKAIAFRAMKDSVLRDSEYHAHAKRCGFIVGLDDVRDILTDPRQDTERQVEGRALLEQAASVATLKEAKIIRLLVDGFALHEAARFLRSPRAAAINCTEHFYCRARATID